MTFSTVRSSTLREWPESKTSAACSTPRRRSSIEISGLAPVSAGWFSSLGSSIASSSGVLFCVVSSSILNIQILYEFGIGLNKVFTQLHLCAHQLVKDRVSLFGIVDFNLH